MFRYDSSAQALHCRQKQTCTALSTQFAAKICLLVCSTERRHRRRHSPFSFLRGARTDDTVDQRPPRTLLSHFRSFPPRECSLVARFSKVKSRSVVPRLPVARSHRVVVSGTQRPSLRSMYASRFDSYKTSMMGARLFAAAAAADAATTWPPPPPS